MKQAFIYSTLFVFCFYLGSCKSSQQTFEKSNPVSVEDFGPLNHNIVAKSKAVRLSETVGVCIEMPARSSNPWIRDVDYSRFLRTGFLRWVTTVEDKIHFLVDNVNSEPFCSVSYYNPLGMRWDLMTQCTMWLYTLNKSNEISKRKIKNNEIIFERISDSICTMRLNIQEDVTGKILVRQYKLVSPFYTISASRSVPIIAEPDLQKIEPWIFQKDIPLLYGKYEILLPEEGGVGGDDDFNFIKSEVIKLGNGEMNVQSKKEEVEAKNITTKYKATKVTATVSNVLPLPKGSNIQPLGIEVASNWESKATEE